MILLAEGDGTRAQDERGGLAEATHLHSGELGSRGPPTPTPHPPTGGWAGAGRPDPRGEEVSPGQPELQTQGQGGSGTWPGWGWGAPGHRVGGGKVGCS